jgi:hypothetical protein
MDNKVSLSPNHLPLYQNDFNFIITILVNDFAAYCRMTVILSPHLQVHLTVLN